METIPDMKNKDPDNSLVPGRKQYEAPDKAFDAKQQKPLEIPRK